MAGVNVAAVTWALQIPCRLDLKAALLVFAARADDDGVLRRPMTTLCYELQADISTVRRIISYLASIGALDRETARGGPRAMQVLRLHVDVAPAMLSRAAQLAPYTPANPRSTARVPNGLTPAALRELEEQPAQETRAVASGLGVTRAVDPRSAARVQDLTRAGNPRETARVGLTRAVDPRSSTRVQLEPPVTTLTRGALTSSTPVKEVVNNSSLNEGSGDVNRGGVGGPPPSPPPRVAGVLLSEDQTTQLVARFVDQFDSEQDVRERIAGALRQPRARNGPYEYVVAWLKKDAVDLLAARSRVRPGVPIPPNGHAKRASPFARAEEMSKQPGGYTLGSVSADPR